MKNIPTTLNLKEDAVVTEYSPTEELLDENFISKAVFECFKNNDPEGVIEVFSIYLENLNKTKTAEMADLPRSTLYYLLKQKNPTIKTLSKLISAASTGLK